MLEMHSHKKKLMAEVIKLLLWLMMPIVLMLVASNLYAIKVVQNKAEDGIKATLELYMSTYEQVLSSTERYLANNIYSLQNDYPFRAYESNSEKVKRQYEILQRIKEANQIYVDVDMIFSYDIGHVEFIADYKSTLVSSELLELRGYFEGLFESDDYIPDKSWTIIHMDDHDYVIRLFRLDNYYAGAVIKEDSLLDNIRMSEFGINKDLFLTNGEVEFETSIDGDTYINIVKDSEYEAISLVARTKERLFLSGLDIFLPALVAFSVLSLIFIPVLVKRMDSEVLLPIRQLMTAMKEVKTGKLSSRVDLSSDFQEFHMMNDTYNGMLDRIEHLMEEVIQEQISKKDAELHYLELQINPHFYMNVLNIIHTMAEREEYELVQEMTMYLVNHFRYVLGGRGRLVTVQEEIEFVTNYLTIQEFRYDKEFDYTLNIYPDIWQYELPPLAIQTFVENSIKYAIRLNDNVEIWISGHPHKEYPNKYYQLIIEDSGEGYPETILGQYKRNEVIMDERGNHFGIYNIRSRMAILYGNQGDIQLMNKKEGGAKAVITIPITSGGEDTHESNHY